MKKISILLISLLVLPCLMLFGCGEPQDPTAGYDIIVKAGESIQEAISAATEGQAIYVSAGTYDEDITIEKTITLGGSREAVLTGSIKVSAGDVAFKNLTINHTYENTLQGAPTEESKFLITGKNFTIDGCTVERMTGVYRAYGDVILYNNVEGTLTIKNCTFIAPFGVAKETIDSSSLSVIGGIPGAESEQKLVMQNTTIKTNGYAVFDRYPYATYTNVNFTGLDESSTYENVTEKTCYIAINNVNIKDVTIQGCTFSNMRNGALIVGGNKVTIQGCTFNTFTSMKEVPSDAHIKTYGKVQYDWGTGTGIKQLTITGCVFDMEKNYRGISLDHSVDLDTEVIINNNTFKNCKRAEGMVNNEDAYTVYYIFDGALGPQDIEFNGNRFTNCDDAFKEISAKADNHDD